MTTSLAGAPGSTSGAVSITKLFSKKKWVKLAYTKAQQWQAPPGTVVDVPNAR